MVASVEEDFINEALEARVYKQALTVKAAIKREQYQVLLNYGNWD